MPDTFRIAVPDERLAFLRARVESYPWDELPDAGGWRSGVGKDDLRRLVRYWLDDYDWRAAERRLNELPQFTEDVDGERLHFVHARGDGSRCPVLLLHGWPGSFVEFEDVVGALVDDGHDVVIPSLPGYAFSTPITGIIGPRRAAELFHRLMTALHGTTRFVVQGGDWGASVGGWLAHDHPEPLLGLHLNMVNVQAEDATPTSPAEQDWQRRRQAIQARETGYSLEQGTRPQTLGAAMADSPVGVAAWIVEKFGVWADLPRTDAGDPDLWSTFTEDQLLTNVMLYLAPSSFVTSTWFYQGRRLENSGSFPAGARVTVPTGVAAFPDPVFLPPPRSQVEKSYDVVHWTEPTAGGHFAAFERPAEFLADLRRFLALVG